MSERNSPDGRIVDRTLSQPTLPREFTRYDIALVAIPAAYLLALLGGVLFSPTLRTTLVGASLVGAAIVGDALFLNPPSADTRGRRDETDGEPMSRSD
ncbi:MAG: hypothetical protein ABEH90_06990 [Halolamina sp.]